MIMMISVHTRIYDDYLDPIRVFRWWIILLRCCGAGCIISIISDYDTARNVR